MNILQKYIILSKLFNGNEKFITHFVNFNNQIFLIAFKFETFTLLGPTINDNSEFRYLFITNETDLSDIVKINTFLKIKKQLVNATSTDTICYLIFFIKYND